MANSREFGPGFRSNHRRPLAHLAAVRAELTALSLVHESTGAGPLSGLTRTADRLAVRLIDRLDQGPTAPLLVAVLGATGTGKSKIFNSLVGTTVSPSGFRRPTTTAPVVYTAGNPADLDRPTFFPGYDRRPAAAPVTFPPARADLLMVVRAAKPLWPRIIMVDTPDFDSVLEVNRTAAGDVFDRSDALIFVTDAIKYADQAVWDYLDRLNQVRKSAILLVNRLKNPLSLEDYRRRLERAEIARPVTSLPDQAGLADQDILDRDLPGMRELTAQLEDWNRRAEDILTREATTDWLTLWSILAEQLLPGLNGTAVDLEDLSTAINASTRDIETALPTKLAVSISGDLRDDLISQIQNQFLRWDLLRYPRKILAMPFNFVKDKVLGTLGVVSSGPGGLPQRIDRLFETNREAMVVAVQDMNERIGTAFSSNLVGRGLQAGMNFSALAWRPDHVRREYDLLRADLENWIASQARELVQGLGAGEKVTFYLAQAVSLGLVVSIQVKTGGLSLFDGIMDGVLAPLVSKITGAALSRDKVKAFEKQAAARHLDGCRELLRRQAQAYLDVIQRANGGLAASSRLGKAFSELTRAMESLA